MKKMNIIFLVLGLILMFITVLIVFDGSYADSIYVVPLAIVGGALFLGGCLGLNINNKDHQAHQ
jgi:hypothetical protein